MKSRPILIALVALCVVQLAVALSMVVRYETTLRNGTPFRVRIEPVDPEDPFQGRYLRITTRLEATTSEQYPWGRRLYAVLETGEDEFARVVSLSDSPPGEGDYVEVRSANRWLGRTTRQEAEADAVPGERKFPVVVSLACDRYYVPESEAPAIEARYREAMRAPGGSKAWIGIRVRDGMAVIESLSTGP